MDNLSNGTNRNGYIQNILWLLNPAHLVKQMWAEVQNQGLNTRF